MNKLSDIKTAIKLNDAPVELVKEIQKQLSITVDGIVGPTTIAAFRRFKEDNHLAEPDTLGPTTAKLLLEKPVSKYLCKEDYQQAANYLGVNVAAIKAVVQVESSGGGFFKNGLPKILFEAHHFDKYTKGIYRFSHPNISSPVWNRTLYYGGPREYERLEKAKKLNYEAALLSTSYGISQILGSNFKVCGYPNVTSFVDDMYISEGKQLMAMCNFIKNNNLVQHLKTLDWNKFSYGYNGSSYRKHGYHTKLANAYEQHST